LFENLEKQRFQDFIIGQGLNAMIKNTLPQPMPMAGVTVGFFVLGHPPPRVSLAKP